MKHKSKTNGSSRKSKMMWLLWLTPLLVMLGFFGRQYQENHKQIIEFQICNVQAGTSLVTLYTVRPYEKLSQLLIQYPNANEFRIGWMPDGSCPGKQIPYCFLMYTRHSKSLWEYSSAPSKIHPTLAVNSSQWKNVSDKAVHAAAKGEVSGIDEISPFVYKKPEEQLRGNSALRTRHSSSP